MSIILDALKKMEGEGETKGSREILPPPKRPLSGRKRGLLLSLAAAVLALNLLAVVLWLGVKDGAGEGGVEESVRLPIERGLAAVPGVEPPVAATELVDPGPDPGPDPGAGAAEKVREEAPHMSPGPQPAVERPVAAAPPLPPAAQEIDALGEKDVTEGVSAVEEEETYDGSVLFVQELPGDLRSGVKDLRISAHVYSDDPAFRRVAVNDNLRREGDAVAADLVVEEITERGAVFNYRGYRFIMESR